jgi:hypothetical protein
MFKMPCVVACAHTSTQGILNIYTRLRNFLTLILIINIPQDFYVWYSVHSRL